MCKAFICEEIISAKKEIKELKEILKLNSHFSEKTKNEYLERISFLIKWINKEEKNIDNYS